MSTGARISLVEAVKAVHALSRLWALDASTCFVVGSVRRGRPDVGDLEFLCPVEPASKDTLHNRIEPTLHNPGGLFASLAGTPPPLGHAVSGFKPGFLEASFVMRPTGADIPVQVFRYTPENLGWSMIHRTGPRDFGVWFLTRWKKAWGIPLGEEDRPASIDGHLVNAGRDVIPVASEARAFEMAATKFIDPHHRDVFAASVRSDFRGRFPD